MRDDEKIRNEDDNKKNIYRPIIIVTIILLVIIGVFIWFGLKNPVIFRNIRDMIITLGAVILFIIGAAVAVLCFFLSSRINDAMVQLDEALSDADGKIEELGDKVTEILMKILMPVFNMKSNEAGIMRIFSKKTEE